MGAQFDKKLLFSENQAITATADSEIIYTGGADGGVGNKMLVKGILTTPFQTGSNTLTVTLKHSDDGSTFSDLMTLLPATATSSLTAAKELWAERALPAGHKPYLKLTYTASATLAGGKVYAGLVPER